ncbi:UDP-N-acetylmuramoyl-tripeptide--D-alanyl-D-alanine ligase [Desulfurivibrio dismutans]|uniref:UDP-N-acetylmuramoyl-tripeptide--D-alanyl-D- alanine ligase n=1 Tax=Desulfurivibrio dismutans TaxID=1398908 RepID=UPI0023DA8547|nr:UDP-N-acetylmuramoyl-tripeptide--D-alanyl-D-alanine ligase [Desulfurivibrio alkaliphilus]MDF1613426.1 UDP-N-acetylmuramoyl-tripeptide--D-alanyl-D-alanine ligase [Desulfurivibrio alkaliphilus]
MEPARTLSERQPRWRACRRAEFGYGFALAQNPVWTLDQVLLATGGRLWGNCTEAVFRLVSADSRTIEAGDLFIALRGENFDGHQFAAEVIHKGAAGLVLEKTPTEPVPVPVVLVPDTLQALGDLAHYRRLQMKELTVLAITGSSGKTTVKEMTAAVMEQGWGRQRVLKTRGNLNNLIGLPLSLLPVDAHHQAAVLEMGMNRFGEIARMTEIAQPDIACITNVQEAHLAGLVDVDGVARAKGELFCGMRPWTTLVVNRDDPRVWRLADKLPQRRITFGRKPGAMVRATHLRSRGEEGMSFTLTIADQWRGRVKITALGAHNVQNALTAAALAVAAGLEPREIVAGLESYRPFAKRLRIQPFVAGLKLIDDSYNANPSSMLAALETVHNLRRNRKVVAILGDMLELGSHGSAAHRFIGEKVARLGFDYLLTVGEFAGETARAARRAGMDAGRVRACVDKKEIGAWLLEAAAKGKLKTDDLVLLKASRGMQMETIVEALSAGREQG